MTLVLARANPDTQDVFVVGESVVGWPNGAVSLVHGHPLRVKIVELQRAPTIILGAAGGLEHWVEVLAAYQRQPNISGAAGHVGELLAQCTAVQNQAFGLVVGIDGCGNARCVKIDKFKGQPFPDSPKDESFTLGTLGVSVGLPVTCGPTWAAVLKAVEDCCAAEIGRDRPSCCAPVYGGVLSNEGWTWIAKPRGLEE